MRRQRLRLRTFGRSNIRKGTSDDSRGLAINTKPASSSRLLSGLDSVFGIGPFALAWVAMVAFGSVLPLRRAASGDAALAPSGISVISTTAWLSETAMPFSLACPYVMGK